MQVATVDAVPGNGGTKESGKPSQAASDAFAILLQNAMTQNSNATRYRGADTAELAQYFSSDNRSEDEAFDASPLPAKDTERTDDTSDAETVPDRDRQSRKPDGDTSRSGYSESAAMVAATANPSVSGDKAPAETAANPSKGLEKNETASETTAVRSKAAQGNVAGPANGQDRPSAQVSEVRQPVVARPNNALSGSTALSAQATPSANGSESSTAAASTVVADTTTRKPLATALAAGDTQGDAADQDGPSDSSGNLLLNGQANKASGQTSTQAGRTHSSGPVTQQAPSPESAAYAAGTDKAPILPQAAAGQSFFASEVARQTTGALRAAGIPAADLSEPPGIAGQSGTQSAATAARPTPSAPVRPAPVPSNLNEQISVQVQKAVDQGVDRIRIQLKPAELGRLDIQLDVAQDGKVSVLVNADRPETLNLLRRDASGLQQALQDAGLQLDSGNLSFNLGSGGTQFDQQMADQAGTGGGNAAEEPVNGEVADAGEPAQHRRASNSTIDVEV